MSSFAENILPTERRPMSIHESLIQDPHTSQAEFFNLYRPVPDTINNSNSVFTDGILTDAALYSEFQSKVDSNDGFDTRQDLPVGLSDGITSDLRGHHMRFGKDSFGGIQFSGSWKPSSDLRNQNRLHSINQISSNSCVLGDQFESPLDSNTNFYGTRSISSITKTNAVTQNNTEGIFPEEGSGPIWCATPWSDRLDSVNDSEAPDWCKQIRDPSTGIDSLFTQSDCGRSWRYRTASDSGRMSPQKRASGHNRAGQTLQRRRGRTLSGGSSASNCEFDGINLPSGHVLNAEDFGAAVNGPIHASLRYTEVSSADSFEAGVAGSKTQRSFAPSHRPAGDDSVQSSSSSVELHRPQVGAIGQPLSVDKSRILMQNSSRLWSSSVPLDAPDFDASVNSNNPYPDEIPLFNSKAYRPPTSDQFTQHDTGLRHNPGLPNNDQTGYSFDTFDNQSSEDSQSIMIDEQLWFYEDPQGRMQGEFGSAQMCGWLFAGRYFTPTLRMRRKCDDTLSTLVDYIKLFGRIPFTPGPRIPPLRGSITPTTILLVRSSLAMQQQQAALTEATLNNIEANGRTTSQMPPSNSGGKFASSCSGDASGLPINFKNGLIPSSSTVPPGSEFNLDVKQQLQQQQQLVLKQLVETFKHGMSINDPVYMAASSILSEMLAKSRICPTDSTSEQYLDGNEVGAPSYPPHPLFNLPYFSAAVLPSQLLPQEGVKQLSQAFALGQMLYASSSMHVPPSGGFGWPPPASDNQQSSTPDPADTRLVGMDNQSGAISCNEPSSLPLDPAIIQSSDRSAVGASVTDCVDSPSKTVRQKHKAAKEHTNTSSTGANDQTTNTYTEGKNKGSKKMSPRTTSQQHTVNSGTLGTGCGKEAEVAPRSISQSGSVSSQSSQSASVWARSTDSPPGNTTISRRLLVNGGGGSPTDMIQITVATSAKSCWGVDEKFKGKAGHHQSQIKSANSDDTNLVSSSTISDKSPGKLSSQSSSECGSQKKTKSRQQPGMNGVVEKTPKKGANSKKGTIIASSSSRIGENSNSDELINLIHWVQSALTGIELQEKLDIPTFVELLTTIDAPYEVESMLLTYIGNSSRSSQFVKEFLDRRHTCWQQHRKRLEEMNESSKSSAPSKRTTPASNSLSLAQEATINNTTTGSTTNGVFAKAYSEPCDPQADSLWLQIKPKNNSNRKGKKTKQRS